WQAAGVRWRVFNPARGWRVLLPPRWRRLHRKLCVVDARICFCGGINIIDDRFDPARGTLAEPRFDFSVRVTGPLAAVKKAAHAGTDANDPQLGADDLRPPPGGQGDGVLAGLVLRDNFR